MRNLLWYLFAGSRGGETRGRITHLLLKQPHNANKLAEALRLDYKTVRHHLEVLEKNQLIIAINKGKYNAVYFISDLFKEHQPVFEEIWAQFGKR